MRRLPRDVYDISFVKERGICGQSWVSQRQEDERNVSMTTPISRGWIAYYGTTKKLLLDAQMTLLSI